LACGSLVCICSAWVFGASVFIVVLDEGFFSGVSQDATVSRNKHKPVLNKTLQSICDLLFQN
jgi:indole-3-glycerol phosphate synthase